MEYMLGFWELKLADDFAKTHAARLYCFAADTRLFAGCETD